MRIYYNVTRTNIPPHQLGTAVILVSRSLRNVGLIIGPSFAPIRFFFKSPKNPVNFFLSFRDDSFWQVHCMNLWKVGYFMGCVAFFLIIYMIRARVRLATLTAFSFSLCIRVSSFSFLIAFHTWNFIFT